MTYKELKKMVESGLELSVMAERQYKKMNESTSESNVDRFMRRNHITVKESDPDMVAYGEFMTVYNTIFGNGGNRKKDNRDMFAEIALAEDDKADISGKAMRLFELKEAAGRWTKFTGSSLPDISFLKGWM